MTARNERVVWTVPGAASDRLGNASVQVSRPARLSKLEIVD
jgi:hypothetical protein